MDFDFDLRPFFFLCIAIGFIAWGGWELIDFIFLEEIIKTKTKINPEIEIIVKDNIIDTLYIYKK